MIVLTGDTRSAAILARLQALQWGRMYVERTPQPYAGEPWGFDNGAFGAWLKGQPFPSDQFTTRLDRAYGVGRPVVAVTPDIVGGGAQSLEFSLGWRDALPDDWPWYLAVQDGMRVEDVRACLDRFAGIFLGGTTRFKSTASQWRRLATEAGLRFHYARAGTLARVEHAEAVAADSIDSTLPLWTRARFSEFVAHVTAPPQPMLPTLMDYLRALPHGAELTDDPLTGCST